MTSRLAAWCLFAVLLAGLLGTHLAATSVDPLPAASACALRFRQPGADWTTVTSVERSKSPAAYYDYYSASAHTEFVEAWVSKAYFYRNTLDGQLYLMFHHNIDDGGSSDAAVTFDFVGLPSGVGVVFSDDSGELRLNQNPEGQWQFFSNTDGGVVGPFPTASEWKFTIAATWGGSEPMRAWQVIGGSGGQHDLDMDLSLELASACNEAPTAVAGGPYAGTEGSPVTFDASGSSDPDGDPLTYSWDWNSDGVFDETTTDATIQHRWTDDFLGDVRLQVSDGTLTSDALASVSVANVPPTISLDPAEPPSIIEGGTTSFVTVITDPGADAIQVTWTVAGVGSVTRSYFTGTSPTAITDSTVWTIGDDGTYPVTITATDDDGGTNALDSALEVRNAAPVVSLEPIAEPVGVSLRIAGEKWHDVTVSLVDRSGAVIASGAVTRFPGSPDDQVLDLPAVDVSPDSGLQAHVVYTPDDDPVNGQPNGANPAWLIVRFSDASEVRLHHTFNVRHPDTYTWDVDLLPTIAGHGLSFRASGSDVGSDDLTFTWTFGDGSSSSEIAYNNGVSPDPLQSPAGVFPFAAASVVRHAYSTPGTYIVTVTVTDDDGGAISASFTLVIP